MVLKGMYKMNSPQGNLDPYYEFGIVNGPTPTVVTNFKLPNSDINKDGPYLQLVEQPQTKFRFRYKSEMVGTHGQLKAESSDRNKNVYPTVKLCNWNGGPALIRLMLYTAEENDNDRRRHVHELSGKNCNKDGCMGGCDVVVDEKNNYSAQFPNLGIIHIAKRDVPDIIYQRKKEKRINDACIKNPDLRNKGIQHNISPTDLRKLKEISEEEAKAMELNKVVLRFQAYFYSSKSQCYRPITEHIDSDIIFNLKNASTGELKIVRISAVSAPATGGTEIWMLVEKVKKNNVKIKFFELDRDGCEIWRDYGEFKESEVHHQYAIVFRAPAYRSSNIREPVQVKMQLERPSDNDTSETIDFVYIPESLKRRNPYMETKSDLDFQPMKRVRNSDVEALNLIKTEEKLFRGQDEAKQPFSPETPYQSPAHMVPVQSPVGPVTSPSQGFYSPPHYTVATSAPKITVGDEEAKIFVSTSEDFQLMRPATNYSPNQMSEAGMQSLGSPNFQYNYVGSSFSPNLYPAGTTDLHPYQMNPNQIPSPMPAYHQVPSPSQSLPSPYQGFSASPLSCSLSPSYHELSSGSRESALDQIQQFDAVQKEVIISKTKVPQFDFSDLVSNTANQHHQNEDMDLLDIISDEKLFYISKDYGDIQADSVSVKDKHKRRTKCKEKRDKNDIDSLTDQIAAVSVSEKEENIEETSRRYSEKDFAFRVAVKAAECLQVYAASGNISLLLATHKYLLGVQNNQGDNSLHTAVLNKNIDALTKIMKAVRESYCNGLLNAQNYAGETPLHLAIRGGNSYIMDLLLDSPGCRLDITDCDGNTALHLASTNDSLPLLIRRNENFTQSSVKAINAYNYNGKTPLHMAVSSGSLENVKILLDKGGQVHLCERKRGANPLHLSASLCARNIAQYLIDHTDIAVDAGMFDGNTALHIAALAKDKEMCSILMKGKANPNALNGLSKQRKTSDSEADDDEIEESKDDKEDYFTPYDYAAGDLQVISILDGEFTYDKAIKQEKDSGIGISNSDLTV